MKKIIILALLLIPSITSAAFSVGWNATSTATQWVSPLKVGGQFPAVRASSFIATSTTATSTFPQLKYTTMETTGAIGSTAGTMYVTGNGALGVASYPYSHFYDATGPVGIGSNTGLGLCAVTKDCSFSGFTGLFNVGIGAYAASGITTGSANFGLGYNSIGVLTTGLRNIGIGAQAMINLQSGSDNIGIGSSDTVGFSNERVLQSITTGNKNIGIGTGALNAAQGDNNVGVGYYAGLGLSSGNGNTIIGWKANVSNTISSSTAIGAEALVSCSNCISIGTSNTNVGIGTTSPYSKLSVVGTTTSAVFVATTTATSTSKGGWDISGGCFAISGTCITGGGSGTNYWTNSGATTTLNTGSVASAGTFNATSTTASVFPYASSTAITVSGTASSTFLRASQIVQYGDGATNYISGNSFRSQFYQDPTGNSAYIQFPNGNGEVTVNGRGGTTGNVLRITPASGQTGRSLRVDNNAGTEVFSILAASGNVGVGTSSPYSKLSVAGQVVAQNYLATSTTATSTFSGHLVQGDNIVSSYLYPSFTYATSTTWTGTTTIPLGVSFNGETWRAVKCFTDVGTLNVSINDGTNRMNMFNASTTVGNVTLSTNNKFVVSEKRYVDIGTPATAPTKVSCTVQKTLDLE